MGLAPLLRERSQTLVEAVPLVSALFRDEVVYEDAAVAKHLKPPADRVLKAAEAALRDLPTWDAASVHAALDGVADQLGVGRGKAFQPVRVAVTGTAVSPPLPETLALLDRALVLSRIAAAGATGSGRRSGTGNRSAPADRSLCRPRTACSAASWG